MRLATIRRPDGTTVAARLEGDELVALPYPDVAALLAEPGWRDLATTPSAGSRVALAQADLAPAVRPGKVICVGLNYRSHIEEMGRDFPSHPTLFIKFADTLTGPYDDLVVPRTSNEVDWEVELGVVIGRPTRNVDEAEAAARIAGYTVVNDVSMRDWQWRTTQWDQGKNFEASTPVGPFVVTGDEVGDPDAKGAVDLEVTCRVDGETMQTGRTGDLLFNPAAIVAYVSQFTTLRPGDLIATGTPGGVGAGRNPKVFLTPGQTLETAIEGIGTCRNLMVEDKR
ncbi:MAG TPA: fumarylacetoacetate hydrolase family protein [Acidimicrobiia bacterium]|nr:fumarylacetoacetate hydrolase family protein [Acidimicrobiia bacterium]